MPTGRPNQPQPNQPQNRGQDQGARNGGSGGQPQQPQGVRQQAEHLAEGAKEAAGQAVNRLREGYGEASEHLAHSYRQAEGTIARNPASSTLISFGIGFGIGLALTALLGREEETWADKYLPKKAAKYVPRDAAKFTGKVKAQAQDTYADLLDHLRDLPEAIASRLPSSLTRR
ncbi:hypothetical protein EP7_002118 [Isosphaeraceae bacterium EP7]